MEMICFTSPKGSCGASFCTVNIAKNLSVSGYRCLVADLCCRASSLPYYLGCENSFVYNLSDVSQERCSFKDALVENVCDSGFDFISASLLANASNDNFAEFISVVKKNSQEYDYVLVDVVFDSLGTYDFAPSDMIVFVTDTQRANVSAVERYTEAFETEAKTYVLINKVIPEFIASGYAMNIDDICDFLGLKPIGIVPLDMEISAYLNSGVLSASDNKLLSSKALWNIAERIKGSSLPAVDFEIKTQFVKKIKIKNIGGNLE